MNRPAVLISGFAFLFGLAPAAYAQSASAEQDADFSAFCREAFPNSAYVKRNQSWGAGHYCSQGGTLQGIDLERTCELTTGSRQFRTIGDRIICAAGPGPQQARGGPLEADDFVEYCRENFPNSSYQFVTGRPENPHYCSQPGATGGFSLQPVDLAAVCEGLTGARDYSERGGQVFCPAGASGATSERRAVAAAGNGTSSNEQASNENEPAPNENEPEAASAEEDGDKDGGGTKSASGKTGTNGKPAIDPHLWVVDVGTLKGATIRLSQKGDTLTGTLAVVPESLSAYVRKWTTLNIGDTVFTATTDGPVLRGRTILGISTMREQDPYPTNCGNYRLGYLNDPSRWPEFEATLEGLTLRGRYRGINVWFKNGGCGAYPFVDYPPLVKNGWVTFDLRLAGNVCLKPKTAAKDGKPVASAKQESGDAKPETPESPENNEAPPTALDRLEAAREAGETLEFRFWSDGDGHLSAFTLQDGDWAGAHGDTDVPRIRPGRILEVERIMRLGVEEGRWPGAQLIYDERQAGTVRGIRIPPEAYERARPYMTIWQRAAERIAEQDPERKLAWPAGFDHDVPMPEADQGSQNTEEADGVPPEEEAAPAEEAEEAEPSLDLYDGYLREAIVPC